MRRSCLAVFFLQLLLPLAAAAQQWTATTPPIDVAHIAAGEINRHGDAVGYHDRPHGVDLTGARVRAILQPPDHNGVYRAFVAVRDPASGNWVDKRAPSTFFPDALSQQAVVASVLDAFRHARNGPDGHFVGPSGHGFAVEGWYEDGRIVAAYPVRERQ